MPLRTVNGGDLPALRPQDELRPRTVGDRAGAEGIRPAPGDAPGGIAPRGGLRTEVGQGDVPDGTDPRVWLGLSVDERAYFARIESEGPLAYGPTLRHGGPMGHRGRHLYIKV